MKFEQGDKVVLIHSGEEGWIVDFINKEMALVDVGGVKFPVYLDQINYPYFNQFSKKAAPAAKPKTYIEDVRKEKETAKYKVGEGLWMALLPVFDKDVFDDDIVEYFKVYLINQTNTAFKFSYWFKLAGETSFELKNEIDPLRDFYLHDVPFETLNDAPRFDFEFSLVVPDKFKVDFLEASLKLKPKQVFKQIEEMQVKQEASFSYILAEEYPLKPYEDNDDLKRLAAAGFRVRSNVETARSVVDLHIEKLVEQHYKMSNFEILTLQLKTFEKFYQLALANHLPQFIIIHGVGTGKLRNEIHELLRLKKEVKSYVNQYHHAYGFGATEIYFK
jgi:hypothetical protein